MKKKSNGEVSAFPLGDTNTLLESGPVIMLSTAYQGKTNIMVQSWHTMIDFEPPIIGCVVSDQNHSFKMLKASKECVINIPSAELLEQVVGCGNTSGKTVDKFKRFGLTPLRLPGSKAPGVAECYAFIACKVIDAHLAGKYNFFILKATGAWFHPSVKNPKTLHHLGGGKFMVSGKVIRTKSDKK